MLTKRRQPTGMVSLNRSLRFESLEDRRMLALGGDLDPDLRRRRRGNDQRCGLRVGDGASDGR